MRCFQQRVTQLYVIRSIVMFGVAMGLLLHGCRARGEAPPQELEGTWRTQAPGYGQNFLRITSQAVAFGADGTPVIEQPIATVERRTDRDGEHYTITYLDADGRELQLALTYTAAQGGRLTFTNQPHLRWTKERGHS